MNEECVQELLKMKEDKMRIIMEFYLQNNETKEEIRVINFDII